MTLKKGQKLTAETTVTLDLWHGGTPTARVIMLNDEHWKLRQLAREGDNGDGTFGDGLSLSKLMPEIPTDTHETVLKVTVSVEVIRPGWKCPVKKWKDIGCTRASAQRTRATRVGLGQIGRAHV